MKKVSMPTRPFQYHEINDRSKIMQVRTALAVGCRRLGMNPHQTGKVEIIAAEIMTNQLKYAVGGLLLFRIVKYKDQKVMVEILGIDKGPGMKDVRHYITDGISTKDDSLGTGLGAIKRLSTEFDIYSYPDKGTVIYSRYVADGSQIEDMLGTPPSPVRKKRVQYSILSVCYPGADVCGDTAAMKLLGGNYYFMVTDGLGHGLLAHEASQHACDIFTRSEERGLTDLISEVHQGMQKTRGGVGAILRISSDLENIAYCGVGNISGRVILNGKAKSLISVSGTLGYNVPRMPVPFELPVVPAYHAVLHSDGMKNNWQWEAYPGLQAKHPMVICAVLYRDSKVTRDDHLVLVVKVNKL